MTSLGQQLQQQRRKQQNQPPATPGFKDQTRLRIEKMEADREKRRREMQQRKEQRAAEEKANREAGNPGDVDFIGMVRRWREENAHLTRPFQLPCDEDFEGNNNDDDGPEDSASTCLFPTLCICVRKRPISDKERARLDHDSVTVFNPTVTIHSAKLRVDGISKYLDHQQFQLDYAFDEESDTQQIYQLTARPLLEFACQGTGGRATIFAYGQTGSGKTYTMSGIQRHLVQDLFHLLDQNDVNQHDPDEMLWCTLDNCRVIISFFEMYGGTIQDLLNNRQRLKILEDGKGEIIVTGLSERPVDTPEELLALLSEGNHERTTHATEANDESSRSHAIVQIMLRDVTTDKMRGKLSLVDLAGSERGTDTKSHNAQRRAESADINTSLLALKECIRALDRRSHNVAATGPGKEMHVPYRGSKLTLILKDCFTSPNAMTTMIATVSPGASATDHSLNTLRYADRIKEQKVGNHHNNNGMIRLNKRFATPSTLPSCPPKQRKPPQFKSTDEGFEMVPALSGSTSADTLDLQHEAWLDQEEQILQLHMQYIAENADLLADEGAMLQDMQCSTDDSTPEYIAALEIVLDRKEEMILNLQEKLAVFRANWLQHQ